VLIVDTRTEAIPTRRAARSTLPPVKTCPAVRAVRLCGFPGRQPWWHREIRSIWIRKLGAERGIRTPTPLRATVFEPAAGRPEDSRVQIAVRTAVKNGRTYHRDPPLL